MAVFIFEALTERKSQGRLVPLPALLAVLMTLLVGAINEFIQLFLPTHVFDPTDILFNFLAAVMAVTGMVALNWARRWHHPKGAFLILNNAQDKVPNVG